jgi:hypothetical protein
MNIVTKWKTGQKLTFSEGIQVLHELFTGANKKLIYNKSKKIDEKNYKLYSEFQETPESKYILHFTDFEIIRPCVSLEKLDHPTNIIETDDGAIFVYEKNDLHYK